MSGFKPLRHRNGAPFSGGIARYHVAASESNDLFVGDPVDLSGTTAANGVPGVQQPAGQNVVGVIVGVENLTSDNLSTLKRTASTEAYVLVADDPDLIFEVGEDATGGALAAASIGLNADFAIGTGDDTYGKSAAVIDSSSAATTATLGLRLLGLKQEEGNGFGADAKHLVQFNLHRHRNATGA